MTPPWAKPRPVVGTRPPPGASSVKGLRRHAAYFGKIQKRKRGTRAGGSSTKKEDLQAV